MKNGKLVKIAVSVALVAGALVYFANSWGESGAMVYYKTVDEVIAGADRFEGRPVRVNGTLVAGSVKQQPGTDRFRFKIAKRGQELDVTYAGIIPDAMQDGRELIVQGVLGPDRRSFAATEIMTKCPSKYEAEAKARSVGP
ncbi:MAG: cytochrome c maturation protein CcmE [Deltaproteobacteria bacterium]|nr:cytochrome c maturation protein CcmE [Deltaproteobacteria bacterium]